MPTEEVASRPVTVASPVAAAAAAALEIAADAAAARAALPRITGAWSYAAAVLDAGSLTLAGRCVGLRVFANGADGSFTVNGGNVIVLRDATGIDLNPQGQLANPVVAWVSGSLDVVIEVVN